MNRLAPLHLRTLFAIVRLGSFQAAADHLGTTQPGVSARVRELEAQLGTALFERQGRRMAPTAACRRLVAEGEPVLAELDRVLLRASTRSGFTGTVRIGTGEIAAASCIPSFVAEVRGRFPHLTLAIDIDLTARMLENLLEGRSDVVLLAGPVAHPAVRCATLGALDLVWLADPATAARVAAGLSAPVWTLPPLSPIHHVALEELRRHAVAHATVNTCNNVASLIGIVEGGGGFGLFPETMTRAQRARGSLVEILSRPGHAVEFQAAVRRQQTDPIVLALFDLAEELSITGIPA